MYVHSLLDKSCDIVGSLEISSFGGVDRPCVNIEYAVAADIKQLQGLDRDDGVVCEEADYKDSDFVPLPVFPQLPIAVAMPEEQRAQLLSKAAADALKKPFAAEKGSEIQSGVIPHYLLDKRGSNPVEYLREVTAILRSRHAKCGPDKLAVIVAFDSTDLRLPVDLASQVAVLTWKKWLALENKSGFTDVFFVSPPLNLLQLRQSDLLNRVSRLHLLYSEESWPAVARYMQDWRLSGGDMNHVWQRLRQWLCNHGGHYDFDRSSQQLLTVCDIPNLRLLGLGIKIMQEMGLIAWEKSAESDIIYLQSSQAVNYSDVDWHKSETFARMEQWVTGFQNTRRVLERRRAEPELFWQ